MYYIPFAIPVLALAAYIAIVWGSRSNARRTAERIAHIAAANAAWGSRRRPTPPPPAHEQHLTLQ